MLTPSLDLHYVSCCGTFWTLAEQSGCFKHGSEPAGDVEILARDLYADELAAEHLTAATGYWSHKRIADDFAVCGKRETKMPRKCDRENCWMLIFRTAPRLMRG